MKNSNQKFGNHFSQIHWQFLLAACLVFAGIINNLSAQNQRLNSQIDLVEQTDRQGPIQQVVCDGEINVPSADPSWRNIITSKAKYHRTIGPNQHLLDSIKKAKLIEKQATTGRNSLDGETESVVNNPAKGTNFYGNPNNGWTPLDNSIAISNGGYIVSLANSTIEIFNTSGTSLYYNSLTTFFGDPSITSVFDPHVLYDRQSNRFIIVALYGTSSSTSKVLVCYSKSSNPATGGWWKYKLTGNPLGNSCWFDFPQIAVTNAELFIAGNLFNNSNNYNQSVIYQINKTQGYSGSTMSWAYWYNLSGSPFSLLPVGHGHGSTYTNCWFVSTSYSGGNWVKLHKITNTLSNGPYMSYYTVTVSSYSPAGDATQPGTSNLLDVGDCRALSGFYLDGTIHFVHNRDKGSGWCGVRYNRVNVSSLTNVALNWFGSANNDYAYPSIASYTTSSTSKSAMIGMHRVSSTVYPEIRVVRCDNTGTWSGSITVKAGNSYVNATSSSTERWGDYSGMSRKHNSSGASVWMSGMYGTSSHNFATYISEIHSASSRLDENNPVDLVDDKTKVFPQPAINNFNLEIRLEEDKSLSAVLFDSKGSEVKSLFDGIVNKGINQLSFNTSQLENGVYMLIVSDKAGTFLSSNKVIVSR